MPCEGNAKRLERLFKALADANDYRPGILSRRLRDAVAGISWLTPETLSRPSIAPLAKHIGVTPAMVAQRQARTQARENFSAEEMFRLAFTEDCIEEEKLENLNTLLQYTNPTSEDVARLLEGTLPGLSEMLSQAASRSARKGAEATNAHYKGKREKLRAIYATGKYRTKRACAQAEHEELGVEYVTAIDYLKERKTPSR